MAAGGRARRFTFIGLSVALGSILPGLGILFVLSAGRPGPLQDAGGRVLAGSISEKIHVEINGVRQGMFIKSRDSSNPVLLFLHGGTGMPEYFLSRQYPTGFEDCMTVVWWDRRGAGLSYDASAAAETLTIEQHIADTRAVTNYLRTRFQKDKIYLMALSGAASSASRPLPRRQSCTTPTSAWGR